MVSALNGLLVLDLSRVLAGPSATQILADLGARVIKVERPIEGDETRHWQPPTFSEGSAAYFATVNRNKESITVDITQVEGQKIIRALAQKADILVENFKVGGLAKYGLDYDSLKEDYPQLIYASLTGFGQTGPDAKKSGYDYIIQGLSGLMSITGDPAGLPQKVGVAVVDLFAGLYLTIGIEAALLARAQTGQGQYVDVALLDSAIAMLSNVGMNYLASDIVPSRLGNQHPNIVPYQVFKAADEKYLILACGNNQQFARLSRLMGKKWHKNEHFMTNPSRVTYKEVLIPQMAAEFIKRSRNEWIAACEREGVPCGPINNIEEALALAQLETRNMIIKMKRARHSIKVLGNPIHLSATPVQYNLPPPLLGEHIESILAECGYSTSEIQKLRENKII